MTEFQPNGNACPLCGGTTLVKQDVVAQDTPVRTPMSILHCSACDFACQWPPMRSLEESREFFSDSFEAAEEGSNFDLDRKRSVCEMQLDYLRTPAPERGSLLDLGSGNGLFAELDRRAVSLNLNKDS